MHLMPLHHFLHQKLLLFQHQQLQMMQQLLMMQNQMTSMMAGMMGQPPPAAAAPAAEPKASSSPGESSSILGVGPSIPSPVIDGLIGPPPAAVAGWQWNRWYDGDRGDKDPVPKWDGRNPAKTLKLQEFGDKRLQYQYISID